VNYEIIRTDRFRSELIEFIRIANLNKSSTTSLLSLLRSASYVTNDQIPKSTDVLWKEFDLDFCYETFYYCSTCFLELKNAQDDCQRCAFKPQANSELCVFSLSHEVRRVVESNLDVIQWYSQPEHQITADIVKGKLVLSIS
jgi:hypothetical protein